MAVSTELDYKSIILACIIDEKMKEGNKNEFQTNIN